MTAPDRTITLFLCGDVMLGRGIDQILPHPSDPIIHEDYVDSALRYVDLAEQESGPIPRPVDFAYVWGDALEEWKRIGPDLRIVNLETAVTRSENYLPKGINYRMHPANAGCILAAGIDCCVLANNHVLDWGEDGLVETLQVLERCGVSVAGAGRSIAEAARPAILDASGKGRVLVFSFAMASSGTPPDWAATAVRPGVNHLPDLSEETVERIAVQVSAARRPRDVAVASIHWGSNWGYPVPDGHRRFAHALIERAGISIVHGHSAHHPLGMEIHRNRLILYGCGDFLNDYEGISGYGQFRSDLTLMYFATLDAGNGSLLSLRMKPLRIRHFRLNDASREEAEWLRRTLDRESRHFGAEVRLMPDGWLRLVPRSGE